jgi:ABC-type transport system substrate-binding protein
VISVPKIRYILGDSMKKIALVLVLAAAALGGCTQINSAAASRTDVTGEAWHTSVTTLGPGGIPLSFAVYYCDGKGVCKQAQMQ